MAKKKYYAVRAGRTPGIYTSWDACKAQVDGFANASFKSFPTKEEAEAFLGNNTKENKIEDEALAYVDGSYNVETGEYSCGVVFFFEGEKTEYCEKGTDSELAAMRNVAGEILGAQVAMKMAVAVEKTVQARAERIPTNTLFQRFPLYWFQTAAYAS